MGEIQRFSVTPTVTAGAYSANDVVGARLQFTGLRQGTLQTILITDKAAQNVDYVLVLFESQPTDITDNATYAIADADLVKIIGYYTIDTGARAAFSSNSIHIVQGLEDRIRSAGGSVWGFLITTGTPTYASTSDISVVLQVEQG